MVAPAQAQGSAVLTGKVVDAASKKGVVDAVVTVTSPALQGEQIVTTDKSGSYRVPSLPPGVYTLHLDKEGFRPYQRDQIQLRADATIRLDADLLPEGLKAEEVVIVAHAPTVDVGSSSTGANINSDFTSRIPVTNPGSRGGAQRTFESVAEATPGAQADTFGTSVNGSTSPENGYFVDGIRTNSAKYGINGSPLSIEFVKEVNVLSGGYMPEYGRSTGGILNVVTKSGSNEYHGSVWANWTPGSLEGKRKYPYFLGDAIQTRRSLGNIYDVGFDQSGPIVKDKLWYYVGFGLSRAIYNLDRSIYASPVENGVPNYKVEGQQLPGTSQQYQATQTSYQFFGKLDYRVNQNNKLALTFAATPTTSGGSGDFAVNPTTGLVEGATVREFNIAGSYGGMARSYRSGAFDTSLKWTSEFDNKSKNIETTIGWHHELGGRRSADGFGVGSGLGYSAMPSVVYRRNPNYHGVEEFERVGGAGCTRIGGLPTCPVGNTYTTGGSDLLDDQVFDIFSAKSVLTVLGQFAGHHVIKAGIDFELLTSWWARGYSGGVRWRESPTGSRYDAQRGYGYMNAPDEGVMLDRLTTRTYSINIGGFIQDSWQIMDKVTLNAGIRYDNQFLIGTDNKMLMTLPNQISPRIGVIFDPTQKGRSKLFVNYARFYESVPLDMLDRQTGEGALNQSVDPKKCNPTDPNQAQGVCLTNASRISFPANGGYAPVGSVPDRKYAGTGGGKVVIDPDISPQSQSEIVAGGEYEIMKNGRFGLSYTRRWMNNVIEDMSNDEGATYFIGNPGKGIAKGFPEATRNYDAGTVYFMKNFADQWLAQVSYTLSWLRGNNAGLYDPTTGQLDPNINATFDLKSLLVNQTGDLPADRRHSFKIFGAKDFSVTKNSVVQVGGSVNVRSGGPTNFLGGNLLYGVDTIHLLPRGTGDRLPWNGNVGTHLGYNVKFENGMTLGLTMDIFNLLNFQTELSRENRYTNQDVLAISGGTRADLPGNVKRQDGTAFNPSQVNPNFGNANIYQEPRQFRFGIRGSF